MPLLAPLRHRNSFVLRAPSLSHSKQLARQDGRHSCCCDSGPTARAFHARRCCGRGCRGRERGGADRVCCCGRRVGCRGRPIRDSRAGAARGGRGAAAAAAGAGGSGGRGDTGGQPHGCAHARACRNVLALVFLIACVAHRICRRPRQQRAGPRPLPAAKVAMWRWCGRRASRLRRGRTGR